MTHEEAKKMGATHYGIEHDEDGENVIYLKAKSWGYHYLNGNLLDEYEEYLLNMKPL